MRRRSCSCRSDKGFAEVSNQAHCALPRTADRPSDQLYWCLSRKGGNEYENEQGIHSRIPLYTHVRLQLSLSSLSHVGFNSPEGGIGRFWRQLYTISPDMTLHQHRFRVRLISEVFVSPCYEE